MNIASYLDGNTVYMASDKMDDLVTSFEQASKILLQWFENNLLKSNAEKCHLLLRTNEVLNINVAGYEIDKTDTEKPVGVKFDKKTDF